MHSFITWTIASLAVLALGAPTVKSKRGITVPQSVPIPLPAGVVQYANAYRKYGKTPPSHVEAAAAAAGTGSVAATPESGDVAYLCPVTVGGQQLNLDFDTGSADLWVFSSEQSTSQSAGHAVYNPKKSKTAKHLSGYTWNITYGDGSGASGDVYTDTVTIGSITIPNQAVEPAQTVSDQFVQDTNNDGLVGLAFSNINTVQPQQQDTWFQTGINQGVFSQNVFTADLKHNAAGSYDFGYIDSDKYTGDITYVDVDSSNGFWEFTGSGYQVGSGQFVSTDIDAIADTGTTLVLMDDSIVSAYYSKIKGAQNSQSYGGYVFPCSAKIPSFSLGIGDGNAVIPASLMSLGSVQTGSKTCFGGLQSNDGIGISIYGDVFLKTVLAVFDADNTQFGWAPKDL